MKLVLISLLISLNSFSQDAKGLVLIGGELYLKNYTTGNLYKIAYDTIAIKGSTPTVLTNKTISAFNYGADAGSTDSYVITLSPAPAAYTTGMIVIFKANTVNTGAASINVNGLGVKTIVKRVNTALANGDIPALSIKMLIYDGTNFTLLNPVVN